MNIALLTKWIWRIFVENEDQTLWKRILVAKYKGLDGLFNSSAVGGSQFWHSMHKIKNLFKLGAKFSLGNGKLIRFWRDWWTGEGPLKDRFPRLFDISGSPNMLVSHAFDGVGWMIHFRRNFSEEEMTQWTTLWDEIKDLSPNVSSAQWCPGLWSQRGCFQSLLWIVELFKKIGRRYQHSSGKSEHR